MKHPIKIILALLLIVVGCFYLSLAIGTSSVNFLLGATLAPEILWSIRLPRVILGGMAGAGLAVSGVVFQAILRNPLADPYIVGVAGGAALGGVLALVLGITTGILFPAFAFGGAVASTLLLFSLAKARGKTDALTLLLVGVIFNSFAAAVVTFLKTIVSATKAQEILFWLMGVIDVSTPKTLMILAGYLCLGAIVLLFSGGALNLLATSDDEAHALGLPVDKARLIVFLAAALLVGAIVAVAGMIGFVGLVVPHILRRIIGTDHRWLIPASLLGGAAFLLIADAMARLTFYFFGTEIPVGVVTAFTGGPFFLFLLLRKESEAGI